MSSDSSTTYQYVPSKLVESYQQAKKDWAAQSTDDDLLQPTQTTAPHPAAAAAPSPGTTTTFTVAATQITGAGLAVSDCAGYMARAEQAIVQAVEQHGAQLVLLPELWMGPYFCQSQEACLQALADHIDQSNPLIVRMQAYAKKYHVVLPLSVYERYNNALYNSVVLIDADGTIRNGSDAVYRKSHIPDGPGYQEKFYFTPGDSGFKVFRNTAVGNVGVAICWDQWFPEAARAMALQGADVILYPTAIGSEPQDPTLDSSDHWQRVMQGHAAANMVPVVASNRYGTEILCHENENDKTSGGGGGGQPAEKQRIHFYGRSFCTDATGAIVAECREALTADHPVAVVTTTVNPLANRQERLAWGLFRDRRPELYGILLTKDGQEQKR